MKLSVASFERLVMGMAVVYAGLFSYAVEYERGILTAPPEFIVHAHGVLILILALKVIVIRFELHETEKEQKCRVCNDVMNE